MAKIDYKAILDEAWQQHLAPRSTNAPTVISTFAGCGGSSLGYSMAGYKELLAVEMNDSAVEIFKANFPSVPVYHGDIASLSVEKCLELAGISEGELDLLDGSPPCQGFSTAGKRTLDDPRNSLFKEYVRLLRGLKPKVFVMENVSGLVKGKMKLVFAEIMKELKESGYNVRCKLLNAKYFLVPQSRQRLIFMGVRTGIEKSSSFPTAQAAPIGIPEASQGRIAISEEDAITAEKHKSRHKAKGNGFGFAALSHAAPAPTLSKTLMKSSSSPRFVVNGRHFLPSPEELSFIGAYPLQFSFDCKYKTRWELIGNSVPPLFMRAIASHIRKEILSSD